MFFKVKSGMFKDQILHIANRPKSGIVSVKINEVRVTFYPNDYEEVERPKMDVPNTGKRDYIRTGSKKTMLERGYLTLEEVKGTGLPYHDGEKWHNDSSLKNGMVLLTKTRCRKFSRTLEPKEEKPVAYRKGNLTHDYSPLYDRTKRVDVQKLQPYEVYEK